RGVLVPGAILVKRGQVFACLQLLGIQRDHLLEGFDGGDGRLLARQRQLAVALPQLGAPAARRRVRRGGRQPGERAGQLVGQPESLGQLVAQAAQRDQRRLVLRILDQRLFQQFGGTADVAAFGQQQRTFAPALRALLRILHQVDEQRRRLGGRLRRA